jgi:hypothetical protein
MLRAVCVRELLGLLRQRGLHRPVSALPLALPLPPPPKTHTPSPAICSCSCCSSSCSAPRARCCSPSSSSSSPSCCRGSYGVHAHLGFQPHVGRRRCVLANDTKIYSSMDVASCCEVRYLSSPCSSTTRSVLVPSHSTSIYAPRDSHSRGGSAAEERTAHRLLYCTVLYSVLIIVWRLYGEPCLYKFCS